MLSIFLARNFPIKPSRVFLTNSANGVGARSICEISARHQRHFRNPQARSRPSKRCPLGHSHPIEDIGTSVLVLAEIRHGIELKRRSDPEQAESLDRWFLQMRGRLGGRVLPIDEPVAEAWALLGIPNPLPLIDGLLAATAKVHGLTFVTRNVADIVVTGVPLLDPFSGV